MFFFYYYFRYWNLSVFYLNQEEKFRKVFFFPGTWIKCKVDKNLISNLPISKIFASHRFIQTMYVNCRLLCWKHYFLIVIEAYSLRTMFSVSKGKGCRLSVVDNISFELNLSNFECKHYCDCRSVQIDWMHLFNRYSSTLSKLYETMTYHFTPCKT